MRILSGPVLMATLLLASCASRGNSGSKPAGAPPESSGGLIVTPANSLKGSVVSYNAGRFVVLSFPLGRLPPIDQHLFVYRKGLRVGEVKVSGPRREDHIVADVTSGGAQAGDEVRDH